MSAAADNCLLCCSAVLNNVENEVQNKNGHFGSSIDLMTLCDILKVSVNEAENYLDRTVSLCLACDADINEIKKTVYEIKKLKKNLSLTMKVVKSKLEISLQAEDPKFELNQIRCGILFDLNNILGQATPENLYLNGSRTKEPKLLSDFENIICDDQNYGTENETKYTPTTEELENAILEETIAQRNKYELRKSTSNISQNESSLLCTSVQQTDQVSTDFSDLELPSDNADFDPDFCEVFSSNDENDNEDKDWVPKKKKRIQKPAGISPVTFDEKDDLTNNPKDDAVSFSNDLAQLLPVKFEDECGSSDLVGNNDMHVNVFSDGIVRENERGSEQSEVNIIPSGQSDKVQKPTTEVFQQGSSNVSKKKLIPGVKKRKKSRRQLANMVACSFCQKVVHKNLLKGHENAHRRKNGEKLHNCSFCNKGFPCIKDVKVHERIHTGERPYICDVCGKSYIQSGYLKIHKKIHTGEKACKCSFCGRGFIQTNELARHLRTHTGERPFLCTVCGKRFPGKTELGKHERVHTGERPYVCDICGKTYPQYSYLSSHRKVHTGERNYKCKECDKTFKLSQHLNRHMKVHTGERNHKCDTCGKCFNDGCSFKRHLRSHTGEKPYKCKFCEKPYADQSKMKRHVKNHHSNNPPPT